MSSPQPAPALEAKSAYGDLGCTYECERLLTAVGRTYGAAIYFLAWDLSLHAFPEYREACC